ncbi:hypothetical protein GCM10023069_69910 [Shinella granuli]
MVRGSRNRAHASNDSCESMVAERFSFVKYGQKEHWAVRLWRTALFAEANEAQLWSSPIPVTILPR